VAYQTAYLKAHYPAEFMAAVLNNQGNIDKIKFYMEECQRMGLQVLGPDVNESIKGFSVAKDSVIRFGMNAIKGVGEAAVEDLITERKANGPFKNVFDFIQRVNHRTVNRKSMENLILAGALDSFTEMHRAQYFFTPVTDTLSGLDRLLRFGSQFQASSSLATNSLFGDTAMPEVKAPTIPLCDPWTLPELLDREKEVIGIYLSAHPLDGYKFEMEHYNMLPIQEVENNKGRTVRIAGFVTDATHMTTKKGSKFGKMVLNDFSGNMEIVLWENNYAQYNSYIDNGQKLMIQGTYAEHKYRPGVMEFQIQQITLLDQIRKTLTKKLHMMIALHKVNMDLVDFMQRNVKQFPGNTELLIQVKDETTGMVTKLRNQSLKFHINDEMVAFLTERDDIKYWLEVA
jgi:DNA polymerase-3 subunit alpha